MRKTNEGNFWGGTKTYVEESEITSENLSNMECNESFCFRKGEQDFELFRRGDEPSYSISNNTRKCTALHSNSIQVVNGGAKYPVEDVVVDFARSL